MRLIDADELTRRIEKSYLTSGEKRLFTVKVRHMPTVETNMDFAKECYAVGYEDGKTERPKSKWIPTPDDFAEFKCSVCDKPNFWEDNFCPNCGACMRGDDNG